MENYSMLSRQNSSSEFQVQEDGKGPKSFSPGPVIIEKKHPGSQLDLV